MKAVTELEDNRNTPLSRAFWCGNSLALQTLCNKIDRLSTSALPVLISGQIGTGKTIAAQHLHFQRSTSSQPFLVSDCSDWNLSQITQVMQSLVLRARGGSIYIKNIDALDFKDFLKIQHYWHEKTHLGESNAPRIIVGSRNCQSSHFSSSNPDVLAWLEFNCLKLQLPTLNERRKDIHPIVEHYIRKHQKPLGVLSAETWNALEQYSWPENAKQVERLIEKLLFLFPNENIRLSQLLKHFPQFEKGKPVNPVGSFRQAEQRKSDISPFPPTRTATLMDSVDNFEPENEHQALVKAIRYMSENYNQNFNLAKLASESFVSPSHLSYLFKNRFGLSFKKILINFRIRHAKEILRQNPARHVTQVSIDVGFSDLSHFEKTFKKHVGVNPKTYRNANKAPVSTISNTQKIRSEMR